MAHEVRGNDAPTRARQIVRSGDVLYSTVRVYLKNLARVQVELDGALASTGFCVLRPNDLVDSNFLFYWVQTAAFTATAAAMQRGISYPAVNESELLNMAMPVPPVDEQRSIVTGIEEQLSRLDAGSANLTNVSRKLANYRRSLLHAASRGRLLSSDSDDQSTEALLKGAGVRLLDATGLPNGWCLARLGDLAAVGSGATPLRSRHDYYAGGTIPWVTSAQLNEEYVRTPSELITEAALKDCSVKLWPVGTLLVAMYGEGRTRGKCSELAIPACTNQACAAIAFRDELVVLRPFVKLFLTASYQANRRLASGGVQPNLSLGLIKGLQVPLPPLAEQDRIVSEVHRRLSIAAALEASIESGLHKCASLRRRILAAAFTGKLVKASVPAQTSAVLETGMPAAAPSAP